MTTLKTGDTENQLVIKEYKLRVGDAISVKFFYVPELNEDLKIAPDGKISLQLIDDVVAAGLTISELDSALTSLYLGKIQNPELTVILREYSESQVYIGGEVQVPGPQVLFAGRTILQSIFTAGGFKTSAQPVTVILIRQDSSNKRSVFSLNLKKVIEGTDLTEDIILRPNDIVFVPKTAITKVNEFIDQYFVKMIPVNKNVGLNINYELNPDLNSEIIW